MTQALTVILKPGYGPIEQYAEVPGMKQGAWTDLYALAAVVYFAITGKTPAPSVGRMMSDTMPPLADRRHETLPLRRQQVAQRGIGAGRELQRVVVLASCCCAPRSIWKPGRSMYGT